MATQARGIGDDSETPSPVGGKAFESGYRSDTLTLGAQLLVEGLVGGADVALEGNDL